MVAIAHPVPSPHRRSPVQPAPRPRLRVIEGGRREVGTDVYRRRRVVAAVALVAAALVSVLVLRLVIGALAAGVLPSPPPAGPVSGDVPAGAATYVVQPGDTLWSIAESLDPSGDVRATVDALARANGGAALDVGDRIVLPG